MIIGDIVKSSIGILLGPPSIQSIADTIDSITTGKTQTLCRFGDGEYELLLGRGVPLQARSEHASERLKEILRSGGGTIKICVSDIFGSQEQYCESSRIYNANYLKSRRTLLYYYLGGRKYGNAFCTRPYMIFNDKANARSIFDAWKSVWNNRDVLVIEGKTTQFGVGNDLLFGAHSVERVVCPSSNAYNRYDRILEAAEKYGEGRMVLASLGITATILSFDLAKAGISALDIGNLDTEYEWFLKGAEKKQEIPGKYKPGFADVSPEYSEEYLNQVRLFIE